MRANESDELQIAVLTGAAPVFDPFTGVNLGAGETPPGFRAADLGLEAPRFCQLCGRRMVVQVTPTGWTARCSRHGLLDSTLGDER